MTAEHLSELQDKVDRHVTVICVSGDEIEGELAEVCADGVTIDVDATSDHTFAGTLLFVTLSEIVSVREVPRPLFSYFR